MHLRNLQDIGIAKAFKREGRLITFRARVYSIHVVHIFNVDFNVRQIYNN